MKKKPTIAIVSLTACEGCQIAILDLGKKFFDFLKKVELVDFALLEEKEFPKGKIDVVFVEGNPIRFEEIKVLKNLRKQAKLLVVIGNCAALGGIPEMKNYQNKEKTIRYIYKNVMNVANPDIKEIDNFVKVDFTIPGCPINNEEFLKYAKILIAGKVPEIPAKPVCSECPYWGKEQCFLRRKEPCLGPIIYAGCGAICTKSEFPCYGCRGFLPNLKPEGFLKTLEKMKNKEEIEDDLEIFGLKDMLK
jgi:coenzyme F420-reducing hydrogenase gamma subunit